MSPLKMLEGPLVPLHTELCSSILLSVDSVTILGTGAKWIATLEDKDLRPGKV